MNQLFTVFSILRYFNLIKKYYRFQLVQFAVSISQTGCYSQYFFHTRHTYEPLFYWAIKFSILHIKDVERSWYGYYSIWTWRRCKNWNRHLDSFIMKVKERVRYPVACGNDFPPWLESLTRTRATTCSIMETFYDQLP